MATNTSTSTNTDARKYDITVWGATGFTGSLVAEYLAKNIPADLTFAIAGRDSAKLADVLQKIAPLTKNKIDVVIANSFDEESLDKMVSQTRVIISTVGPYTKYGTPLVESCVRLRTHYCDLTGEPTWIRTTIDKFHKRAQETRTNIVHCCGFDSVPSDLGAYLAAQTIRARYGGECGPTKMIVEKMRGGISGGTFASVFAMIEDAGAEMDKAEDPYYLNDRPSSVVQKDFMRLEFDQDFNKWVYPFVMAAINAKIVRRSNELLGDKYGSNFSYNERSAAPNFFVALIATIALAVFFMLAKLSFTRPYIKKFVPQPGEGPDLKTRTEGFFNIKLISQVEKSDKKDAPKTITTLVKGFSDPGYQETSKMISESAITLALLREDEIRGGILTPASSMGDQLIKRLRDAGMVFEVVDEQK